MIFFVAQNNEANIFILVDVDAIENANLIFFFLYYTIRFYSTS